MFPLNPLQAKGLFTFIGSITMSLSPLAEPVMEYDAPTNPPVLIEQTGSLNLSVPFSPQAPEANWQQPWGDACEETTILMVDRFYKGRTEEQLEVEEAKKAILNIVRTKEGAFGPSYDENLMRMTQMIELINSNWKGEVKENPTLEELKKELTENRPVIVPVSFFPNPHYLEALDYHMLVLTGFNDEKGVFIVNDPGTRFGNGVEFGYSVVMEKMHDLNKPDYEAGAKRVLFTRLKD